ncbi:hypothetical protein LJC59_07465 [Desulfovibrio sp. OttesenSCG-928-A18]|nr:hypothetical protein [Desulfovibrio sp. OttesenSCG-928-A18]
MLIGLDVGGTNTDAVLLRAKNASLVASFKAPTRPDSIVPGMIEALRAVVRGHDASKVRRVALSSTLGLNSLLSGNTLPVGMLVVAGPGIDPRLFWGEDPLFRVLSGAQDHRGRIVSPPDPNEIREALASFRELGVRALGIVCKFSPKNPELENSIAELAVKDFGPDMPVITGWRMGGTLNFPRRMHSVWCNAALAGVSRQCTAALRHCADELGLRCPLMVLKADAGVFSLEQAGLSPASSMGSGPAAGLLGIWAEDKAAEPAATPDALMIDIGGTSTDLSVLARGSPILVRRGLNVAGRPTLIRALWTRSLALGGDSSLRVGPQGPSIGPDRLGPALALAEAESEGQRGEPPATAPAAPGRQGGCAAALSGERRPPTLTDALNVLGLAVVGNAELSRKAMAELAGRPDSPEKDAAALSRLFVRHALERLRDEAAALLSEVNARPVYTIRELLLQDPIEPEQLFLIGGPAPALAREAEKAFGLPARVPRASAWANAIGVALARPTKTAELYADTLLGRMHIPDLDVEAAIDRSYGLDHAKKDLKDAFAAYEREKGTELAPLPADGACPAPGPDQQARADDDLQFPYAESFAMLDERNRRGRSIRVMAQRAPGLLFCWKDAVPEAGSHGKDKSERKGAHSGGGL